ncbi:MAG: hypothetical protein R3B45_00295 [Bdellovibrionota bacterium]
MHDVRLIIAFSMRILWASKTFNRRFETNEKSGFFWSSLIRVDPDINRSYGYEDFKDGFVGYIKDFSDAALNLIQDK